MNLTNWTKMFLGFLLLSLLISPVQVLGANQVADVRLKTPAITITHQSSSLGSCFQGGSEPCDVFAFTSKFTCGDCLADFAASGMFFEISAASDCSSASYSLSLDVSDFIATNQTSHGGTFQFPATLPGGKVAIVMLQIKGNHGLITITGNADLSGVSSAPVFVGLLLGEQTPLDADDPADFICSQVTPSFQNLP